MSTPNVRTGDLAVLESAVQAGGSLSGYTFVGIDLSWITLDWSTVDVSGAVFLGCTFNSTDFDLLRSRGASILDRYPGLPYNPFRLELYTPQELMRGADERLDTRIYSHFIKHGGRTPDLHESLAQRIHDFSIDAALAEYLAIDENGDPQRRVVGIMGGHANKRNTDSYKKIAELCWHLASDGYLIASGGGPGIMEAANLGAYLSAYPLTVLTEAMEILAQFVEDKTPGYLECAWEILEHYPAGRETLSIPTWYYSFETMNIFATKIAKYFSNSIREDGLITFALSGIVFAPGGAGTRQEIFMDAAQNHYGTLVGKYDWFSPMVFLGTYAYQVETNIFQTINQTSNANYKDLLFATDDIEEALHFIKSHPPVKKNHLTL